MSKTNFHILEILDFVRANNDLFKMLEGKLNFLDSLVSNNIYRKNYAVSVFSPFALQVSTRMHDEGLIRDKDVETFIDELTSWLSTAFNLRAKSAA